MCWQWNCNVRQIRNGISALAIAATIGWITPVEAQESEDTRAELAEMRAQIKAMAARIDSLETQLNMAKQRAATTAAVGDIAVSANQSMPENAKAPGGIAWKGAPEVESSDGWTFKPRGRLQYDAGFTSVPSSSGRVDGFGSELRRARLGVEGDIPGGFGYKMELDFAGGTAEVTDAILSYQDKGLTVTVGQQNNFQGLEELTSSRFTSMMERAAFTDAFNFERRVGLALQYSSGPILLQGGVFSDNYDDLSNKNWGLDGRAVFLPKIGNTQLHLAGSLHYTSLQELSTVRYRQRPLVHFTSDRFIDTGALDAESEIGYGLEAAAIHGPFHFASEGYWQHLIRPGALSDPTFFGGYTEIGMFLTPGDSRRYKKGVFDRAKPSSPVGNGGFGSVEVNLRYDYLDLTDAGIVGGTQNGYQLSVVWAPIDYVRFLLNYARLDYTDALHAIPGTSRNYSVDAFGARAQIDF